MIGGMIASLKGNSSAGGLSPRHQRAISWREIIMLKFPSLFNVAGISRGLRSGYLNHHQTLVTILEDLN